MSKAKAFWLSLLASLAVVLPVYLAVAAYGLSKARPTETTQSGVPVAQPMAGDTKTVLVMTGDSTVQTTETYALVHFDAYENTISVASLPRETVLLLDGSPLTLQKAVETAGPSQGVAALKETLGIRVDNYLFCTPATLCKITEGLGNARLRLSSYLDAKTLGALQLDVPGAEVQALPPAVLAEVLGSDEVEKSARYLLRGEGYLAMLKAGEGVLPDVLPAAVRKNSTKLATNITATQLYDYERILKFLKKQQPSYAADVLPGTWQGERYELSAEAVEAARRLCGTAKEEAASPGILTEPDFSALEQQEHAEDAEDAANAAPPEKNTPARSNAQ